MLANLSTVVFYKTSGHLSLACPFSDLCWRCKQPGDVARECGEAQGQPHCSSSLPVPSLLPVVPPSPALDPVFTPSIEMSSSPVVPSSPASWSSPSAAPDKSPLPDSSDKYLNMDPPALKNVVKKQYSGYRKLRDRSLAQIVQAVVDSISILDRLIESTVEYSRASLARRKKV